MKMKLWLGFWLVLISVSGVHACVWDADTLAHEKSRSHDLAAAILGAPEAPDDPQPLQARIRTLEAKPDTNNPDWWNNLAGAYIRLGQPATAVKLLEPVGSRFPENYGIHANLGTAYHLLGRYAEAEGEIAWDLQINPAAHFGLEKYHLALLQYLTQSTNYQSRHLYVDEFTADFLYSSYRFFPIGTSLPKVDPTTNLPALEREYATVAADTNVYSRELADLVSKMIVYDPKPAYQTQWNLAEDTNFEAGVIYMAQMNPQEPACFEMLGIAAWKKREVNLASAAFKKAIALGSPKAPLLKSKVSDLDRFISESHSQQMGMAVPAILFLIVMVLLVAKIAFSIRKSFVRRRATA